MFGNTRQHGIESRVPWLGMRYYGCVGILFALSVLVPRRPGATQRPICHSQKPSDSLHGRCLAGLMLFFSCEILFMTKLYVGNLPFTATEDAVRALFTRHGTVETLSLISDRDTGRARGFGFIEMSSADASRAMQALNGQDFDGRPLKINEAQERTRSNGGPSRY
jgi:hypothetical protein